MLLQQVESTKDDHPVISGIINSTMPKSRCRQWAGWGQLGPRRCASLAVGVAQHPDVVKTDDRASGRVHIAWTTPTKHDHSIACGIVHGGVLGASRWGTNPPIGDQRVPIACPS